MSSLPKESPQSEKLTERHEYRHRLNQIVSDLGGRDAMSTKEYEIAQRVAALNIREICSLVARFDEERSRAAQRKGHPTKNLWVRWGLPIAIGAAVALVALALISLFGHGVR